MLLIRRIIVNFSLLPKYQAGLLTLTLQSQFQKEKHLSSSGPKFKKVPSSLFKYELFSENTAPTILDVEKERQKIATEEGLDEFEGISLKWGTNGVIDVEEVVDLLKREKGEDIFVVKVPPEYNYADNMVFVTGRSQRHMWAMANFVRRLYKKRVCSNNIPNLEGKNSKQWMAIDLGNVVLHVFSASGRKYYDLETLWTVGKDYDDLSHRNSISHGDITDYTKLLTSLSPNT